MEIREESPILFQDLDEAKARIIIPTVSVSELMCPIDPQQHGHFAAIVSQRFHCPPFDLPAAALAARLWQHNRSLPPEEQIQRSILKADVLILATAKTAGARYFFSHDAKCRKLAEFAGMIARDLPTHSQNLFTQAEIKREGTP